MKNDKDKDRRTLIRNQIKGVNIQFRRLGVSGIFNHLSKPVDIIDLSKSGVSFIIEDVLSYGDAVYMKLNFLDGKCLRLKGQIRWNKEIELKNRYSVGIQFFPFGSRSTYNPIDALEYLRSFENQEYPKPDFNGNEIH